MEEYIIKIKNPKNKSTKYIDLSIYDFLQTYYEGFSYDLEDLLTNLYLKNKNKNLIIKIQNCKNEPNKVKIFNGIKAFKTRNQLI